MPVLGHGGSLELSREPSNPVVIPSLAINSSLDTITLSEPSYWSGDQVQLTCANGLPLHHVATGGSSPTTGTEPDAPDGYGVYAGSMWFIGYNKLHIADDNDEYYKPLNSDSQSFYAQPSQTGLTVTASYYIHRDQLDRISFYTTQSAALKGTTDQRIPLYKVDVSGLILSSAGNSTYLNTLDACAVSIKDLDLNADQEEKLLRTVCSISAALNDNDTTNYSTWRIQAYLSNWTLNLSAPEVDTTALGERFGESVKSLVTGGGSMDFLIEYAALDNNRNDSTSLLKLLLLTQKGCKATAKFYMFKDRAEMGFVLPGSLYYETDLMITSEAINTRAEDIIAGSLDFVTVGAINLRMGNS